MHLNFCLLLDWVGVSQCEPAMSISLKQDIKALEDVECFDRPLILLGFHCNAGGSQAYGQHRGLVPASAGDKAQPGQMSRASGVLNWQEHFQRPVGAAKVEPVRSAGPPVEWQPLQNQVAGPWNGRRQGHPGS